tara:strand:- start:145 stop:567 length:423 start_codon:yes stop_codon:yes gene_type:complete
MPSTSIAQQRLMGQAHGVQIFFDTKGKDGIDPKTLDAKYREDIVNIAKSMDPKDLKDFAETKHKGLPNQVGENSTMATPGSVNGMGSVSLPGDPGTQSEFGSQKVGSGDKMNQKQTKKKRKKQFKSYREFIGSDELRKAF